MPAPKSVTKITKDGVTFTSNVDVCQYYIHELCRAALRDVAKFIKKEFKKRYNKVFREHSKRGSKGISYTIYSSKKTTHPRLDLGWKSSGKAYGFYSSFQELGTKKTPGLGLLAKSTEENIDMIIKIQSQYLSYLSKDEIPDSIIDEEEDEGKDED